MVFKKLVEKKKLYPYTAGKKFKFVQLFFKTVNCMKKCKNFIGYNAISIPGLTREPIKLNMYESNVDPINRFCHVRNITTTGWIRLKRGSFSLETDHGGEFTPEDLEAYRPDKYSRAQIAVNTHYKYAKPYLVKNPKDTETEILKKVPYDKISPMKILSWDIETYSEDGSFPNPKKPGDKLAQIGITLWNYGSVEKTQIIISDRECADVPGIYVLSCKNEAELLRTFCMLVETTDPDMITGYNTWKFDDLYFWVRLEMFGMKREASVFSRLIQVPSGIRKRFLISSAYGDNEYNFLECHGRETFDLFAYVIKDVTNKLPSYKLDDVGFEFTGQRKTDLADEYGRPKTDNYRIMFNLLDGVLPENSDGTVFTHAEQVAKVAEYCVQDTNLVIEIIDKQALIPNTIEMAKATYVPIDWLLFRGQQCRVFSLVVKEAREQDFVVPIKIFQNNQKFAGATVLEPKRGAYFDAVAGLDFASLYPSIMIAFNMCYSTLVLDKKFDKLDDTIYEDVIWDGIDKETGITDDYHFTFVQPPETESDGTVKGSCGHKGLLPVILERLWKGRKATKKEMKSEKDPYRYKVLNGKQMAQKVTMNSVYGFTGTGDKGMLPCKAIASSVTAKGRQMIDQTSELAEELYSCEALYGDSIPGYENVTILNGNTNRKDIVRASKLEEYLGGSWTDYRLFKAGDGSERSGKEQMTPGANIYAMSGSGPSKIKRVIRHKAPGKKIYRVKVKDPTTRLTRTVMVTEGHSLIGKDGSLIKAEDLKIGSKLFEI
jgi:DNA polymerase delta subunit 1